MAKAKSGKGKPVEKHRSAKTGQYVTKKYAEKHPNTTIKEIRKK